MPVIEPNMELEGLSPSWLGGSSICLMRARVTFQAPRCGSTKCSFKSASSIHQVQESKFSAGPSTSL